MKPTDLKYPFNWEERRPSLSNGVLFIPKYYDKHQEEWNHRPLFENAHPVFIEYCSGNGAWIIEKAQKNPGCNWIAVEQKFERVRKIWTKARNREMTNLLIICGEALTFTRHYLLDSCIEGIYVNFPDPWPKEKHAKNRLIQSGFVKELARVVKKEGTATLVTDDVTYCQQMISSFFPLWNSLIQEPYYSNEWSEYGESYFDALWRKKGRNIHYLHFVNI